MFVANREETRESCEFSAKCALRLAFHGMDRMWIMLFDSARCRPPSCLKYLISPPLLFSSTSTAPNQFQGVAFSSSRVTMCCNTAFPGSVGGCFGWARGYLLGIAGLAAC